MAEHPRRSDVLRGRHRSQRPTGNARPYSTPNGDVRSGLGPTSDEDHPPPFTFARIWKLPGPGRLPAPASGLSLPRAWLPRLCGGLRHRERRARMRPLPPTLMRAADPPALSIRRRKRNLGLLAPVATAQFHDTPHTEPVNVHFLSLCRSAPHPQRCRSRASPGLRDLAGGRGPARQRGVAHRLLSRRAPGSPAGTPRWSRSPPRKGHRRRRWAYRTARARSRPGIGRRKATRQNARCARRSGVSS